MRMLSVVVIILAIGLMAGDAQAQALYILESPNAQPGGAFGHSVSGAGDVNSDSHGDLIVGAESESVSGGNRGRAYVFSGNEGGLLHVFEDSTDYQMSTCSFGILVSGDGDLNNDGYDDLIVTAVIWSGIEPCAFGFVLAYSGETGEVLHSWDTGAGACAGMAGDVNYDGHDDIITGYMHRVLVYSGNDYGVLYSLLSPNPEAGGGTNFGCSVSGVSDLNNDGCDDLLMGANREDGGATNAGRAYVFGGSDGGLLHTLVSAYPESAGMFGSSVSGAGDVDNDGYEDVIVGAPYEDGGAAYAGRAYIFSGNSGSLIRTLQSPNPEINGYFGWAVSDVGDVDSDGYDDVVVGAHCEDGGAPDAGRAYIFSGNGDLLYILQSANPESAGYFGCSVSGSGDMNNDGFPEIIVGAYKEDGGATDAGRVYVFSGIEVPVELNSFAAAVENGKVVLTWSTLSEKDNFGFHVYRSMAEARNYRRITHVMIPGAGNSTVGHDYNYTDRSVEGGATYFYMLADIDSRGRETLHGPASVTVLPGEYSLTGNHPNPFSETTTLKLILNAGGQVRLRIYNLAGELIKTLADRELKAGVQEISWDGRDDAGRLVAPGTYTCIVEFGGLEQSQKMILIR